MYNFLRSLVLGVVFGLVNSSLSASWNEPLPLVIANYKVHVDAGKEDCYFQYASVGADFYVHFQVIRGGDGKAAMSVRNPDGIIVHPYQWLPNSAYQDSVKKAGYYCICVDNQFSRFASKLVNLYISVIRYDKWDKYAKELEELNLSVDNFTNSVTNVEKNVNEMYQTQYLSRSREERDFNLLLDNNFYVQMWSITQITVIIVTTTVQIYFVRKLFEVKPSKFSRAGI
ncbi:transmembrane emp24 domain-containing protein 6 [Megalopta genalis]|uniref:transmembrane emp24 domain-containing protein 6 n=1 Tax=Megalopta genalis TaxID=115081 RepID=UPI00144332DB|nr:transmembrane emp24 domain-containing protein 6-like [Megalopta genalis]